MDGNVLVLVSFDMMNRMGWDGWRGMWEERNWNLIRKACLRDFMKLFRNTLRATESVIRRGNKKPIEKGLIENIFMPDSRTSHDKEVKEKMDC